MPKADPKANRTSLPTSRGSRPASYPTSAFPPYDRAQRVLDWINHVDMGAGRGRGAMEGAEGAERTTSSSAIQSASPGFQPIQRPRFASDPGMRRSGTSLMRPTSSLSQPGRTSSVSESSVFDEEEDGVDGSTGIRQNQNSEPVPDMDVEPLPDPDLDDTIYSTSSSTVTAATSNSSSVNMTDLNNSHFRPIPVENLDLDLDLDLDQPLDVAYDEVDGTVSGTNGLPTSGRTIPGLFLQVVPSNSGPPRRHRPEIPPNSPAVRRLNFDDYYDDYYDYYYDYYYDDYYDE